MTAPAPSPTTETPPAPAASGDDKGGQDTDRAGQDLSREALEVELRRARDDAAKFRSRSREFADDAAYQRAKDAVAALEKAEQDKKSEVEKLTEKSEGLLHRASNAETELTKLRVALAAGIDVSQVDEFASRLRGDTESELKADAEQLAKFFAPAAAPRRGDPSQGAGTDRALSVNPIQAALEDKLGLSS